MEDRSFLNLIDNISRIDIDANLIESFKRVMATMQSHFNKHGYTEERNYEEYFRTYLYKKDDIKLRKLRIYESDEPSKRRAYGFYSYSSNNNSICIDNSLKKYHIDIDPVIAHEFIHFLTIYYANTETYSDNNILNSRFIREALTEMLTRQMYPKSDSYEPQVRMLEFANILNNTKNRFKSFLKGEVDARGMIKPDPWKEFENEANRYQEEFKNKGYIMRTAITDTSYIAAQRTLIKAQMNPFHIKTLDEYIKKITQLQYRPVPDNDFVDELIEEMDKNLLKNIGFKDEKLNTLLKNYLKEIRNIIYELEKYENPNVHEFEIGGYNLAIDEKGNILKPRNFYNPVSLKRSMNTENLTLLLGTDKKAFKLSEINFEKRRQDLLKSLNDLTKKFTSYSKTVIESISKVANNNDLLKLEEFALPTLTNKSTPINIASYSDRIEVLNNASFLGEGSNINLYGYDELGEEDPTLKGKIKKGFVYTTLTEKQIKAKATGLLCKKYNTEFTSEQINSIIEQYKKSDKFDKDISEEDIRVYALNYYADMELSSLSEEAKKMISKVINDNERYIIFNRNGEVKVSLLTQNELGESVAYESSKSVLVDSKKPAKYNDLFKTLSSLGLSTSNNIQIPISSFNLSENEIQRSNTSQTNLSTNTIRRLRAKLEELTKIRQHFKLPIETHGTDVIREFKKQSGYEYMSDEKKKTFDKKLMDLKDEDVFSLFETAKDSLIYEIALKLDIDPDIIYERLEMLEKENIERVIREEQDRVESRRKL